MLRLKVLPALYWFAAFLLFFWLSLSINIAKEGKAGPNIFQGFAAPQDKKVMMKETLLNWLTKSEDFNSVLWHTRLNIEKKIAKLRQSCDNFCVHNLHRQPLLALLQLITFVCTNAINNFVCTASIVNFCLHVRPTAKKT